jgi:CheY-like chemotaxis protein
LFQHNATNKKNELQVSVGIPNDSCRIITDEAKLNQIITNLVSNAIKFTEKGQIEIGYRVDKNELEFYVSDTGIGISPENQKVIFDRFRQVEEAPTRNYGGTGLGLAICKAYVEVLGGKIGVKSSLGMGSQFYFSIPFTPVMQVQKHTPTQPEAFYDFSATTILVAEDEPANFFYVNELLSETGAIIIHVEDGEKALDYIRKNRKADIVLMDIKMPVMNGIDSTKAIRALGSQIPIIALTAYAMSGDKATCMDAGCNAYVPKPIIKDDLLSMIEMYIKK